MEFLILFGIPAVMLILVFAVGSNRRHRDSVVRSHHEEPVVEDLAVAASARGVEDAHPPVCVDGRSSLHGDWNQSSSSW
jgi:hypothetical protein